MNANSLPGRGQTEASFRRISFFEAGVRQSWPEEPQILLSHLECILSLDAANAIACHVITYSH